MKHRRQSTCQLNNQVAVRFVQNRQEAESSGSLTMSPSFFTRFSTHENMSQYFFIVVIVRTHGLQVARYKMPEELRMSSGGAPDELRRSSAGAPQEPRRSPGGAP